MERLNIKYIDQINCFPWLVVNESDSSVGADCLVFIDAFLQ